MLCCSLVYVASFFLLFFSLLFFTIYAHDSNQKRNICDALSIAWMEMYLTLLYTSSIIDWNRLWKSNILNVVNKVKTTNTHTHAQYKNKNKTFQMYLSFGFRIESKCFRLREYSDYFDLLRFDTLCSLLLLMLICLLLCSMCCMCIHSVGAFFCCCFWCIHMCIRDAHTTCARF